MGLRAYWEQKDTQGITHRIEIDLAGFSGSAVELLANAEGFRFRHDEITSEQSGGIINPYANRIQKGTLDFFPRIQSSAQKAVLDDILGETNKNVLVTWKQDGSDYWKGYADTEKLQHPESPVYFGRVRATDFGILDGEDFIKVSARFKLIELIAQALDYLDFDLPIRTATTLTENNITESEDFLNQIYADRFNLEIPGSPGRANRHITVLEALTRMADSMLIIRQLGGVFQVHQLSAFDNPEAVAVTTYDPDGSNPVATTEDLRQTGYESSDDGFPVVKISSQNDIYPAIKRARVTFDHRTTLQNMSFASEISITDSDFHEEEQLFLSDGNQSLELSGVIRAFMREGSTFSQSAVSIVIVREGLDNYTWNGSSWVTSGGIIDYDLTEMGGDVWQGNVDEVTTNIPAGISGTLRIRLFNADGSTMPSVANETLFRDFDLTIRNPSVEEGDNTAIDYQLTQTGGYPTVFDLGSIWFGDGPTSYARSALTRDEEGTQLTAGQWGRRGQTLDKTFAEAILKEVLDLQRSNIRKLQAQMTKGYDPKKILVYQTQNLYYAGGEFSGIPGRWQPTLYRINAQEDS